MISVRSRKSTLCGSEDCRPPNTIPEAATHKTHTHTHGIVTAQITQYQFHVVGRGRDGRRDSRRSRPCEVTICNRDSCPVALRCVHSFLFGNIPSNVLSDAVNYSNLLGRCRSRFSRRNGDPVLECTHRSEIQ
ncbi:exo-alpha-sialidase [Trypanosoma cruzi]|nr:exo-alpha-sialidase [Trypanosoma cruzi]